MYIDLDGNTISNSSDAISKWSPIDNLGVQQDDTNILLTFDREANSEFDDAEITFTVTGDSGLVQEALPVQLEYVLFQISMTTI